MFENIKNEILSPAGDMESLINAINFGADAVYLAGKSFGMRTSSKNFDNEELQKALDLAHSKNVKVYITCNTLPTNEEVEMLPQYLTYLNEIGVDAVIVADIGTLMLAKEYAPNVQIHISTQAGIVNYQSANAFYKLGASRVVLARELSLKDILKIRQNVDENLEIECFVHGAMCVSFSGRCLISAYMNGRDANKGDCSQPCRWKYHLYEENREGHFYEVSEEKEGTYLYNSKDLCMIDHIKELAQAGITSFKIEGRAKSAYYTAVITNAYRKALDDYKVNGHKEDYKVPQIIRDEVYKISHREYSTGFFFGYEPGQNVKDGGYIREYDVVAVCDNAQTGVANIVQRNRFFVGDELDVLPPDGIPFLIHVKTLINEKGEMVEKAPHAMEKLIMHIDENIIIPNGSVLRKKRS